MKSEFLSHAAHELRTPMTSIYGFTEMLLVRKLSDERRKELLDIILRQSRLMISIINELLDLARIDDRRGQNFELTAVDLRALVSEAVFDLCLPLGRERAEMDLGGSPCPVQADKEKLLQAIRNILSNAYKYSPDGGPVTIGILDDSSGTTPRIGIRVADRGIGMTPAQAARVCERFYRADSSGSIPGTGLGMSIVKEIIEMHGGQTAIESRPGAGTTVTLWLPALGAQISVSAVMGDGGQALNLMALTTPVSGKGS
jgi:signal transduction histidine kinase